MHGDCWQKQPTGSDEQYDQSATHTYDINYNAHMHAYMQALMHTATGSTDLEQCSNSGQIYFLMPLMGKWERTQNFGFTFCSGTSMIRVWFCSGSEYFLKIRLHLVRVL